MKKIIFLLSVTLGSYLASNAQLNDVINQAKTAAGSATAKTSTASKTASGFNISDLSKSIMGQLTPSLGLTKLQQPNVLSAVTTFLTAKSKIMPLLSSNPTSYLTKQNSLFSTLKTKLEGVLLKDQMAKFMGLKSTATSPTNVLSNLFK